MKKALFVLAVVVATVVGCAPGAAPTPEPDAPTSTPAAPFVQPTPSYSVEVTKDIEYLTLVAPDAPVQKVDVYAPAEPGPWPVVVLQIGWYQSKDTPMYLGFAEELAGRGVVVFVADRRSPCSTLSECVEDDGMNLREVQESWACAVRFAREKAADYGGDPEWLTVYGDESSGLESAFLGDDVRQAWDEVASSRGGPPAQTECLATEGSAHVDVFIGFGGNHRYYQNLTESDPDLWALTSPFGLIGRNPSLVVQLIHGGMGNPTNIQRAEELHEELVNAGYDAKQMLLGEARWRIPASGPDREELIQIVLNETRP
jgi:hypothetical protein